MLTIDLLNASIRRYWVAVTLAIAPGMALLLSNGAIDRWLVTLIGRRAAVSLSLVLLAVSLGLLFAGIFLAQRLSLLKCPNCGKMVYPNTVGIVIATKHCTKCGALVIPAES